MTCLKDSTAILKMLMPSLLENVEIIGQSAVSRPGFTLSSCLSEFRWKKVTLSLSNSVLWLSTVCTFSLAAFSWRASRRLLSLSELKLAEGFSAVLDTESSLLWASASSRAFLAVSSSNLSLTISFPAAVLEAERENLVAL